jgi:8-oxo-dGTP diphosphatase
METALFSTSDRISNAQIDVLVVVFSLRESRLKVLLKPHQPALWELPGLPLKPSVSLEDTATRVLEVEISLREAYLEQLYTYGDPQRTTGNRVVSVVYFALISTGASRSISAAGPSQWFPVDELPPMAMDHAGIIEYALRRLRYKLEYSAVGFQLLPEAFTLSELQRTYEIILGEKIDKRNFRRRILDAGVIEPTSGLRTGEGRPARLYHYKPDAVAEVKARRLFP